MSWASRLEKLPSRARAAWAAATSSTDRLSDDQFVRAAYEIILRRPVDTTGLASWIGELQRGDLTRQELSERLLDSPEFFISHDGVSHLWALHLGRCEFARRMPAGSRILDLGGTSLGSPDGALVELGYRHRFERLVIVELPADQRHELYTDEIRTDVHEGALGTVEYRYHSMAELDGYEPDSFDLVYSGQTIEHIDEALGDQMLAGVARVLAPGGWFVLDTPNGPVCRLHSPEVINPDHKIEYSHAQLTGKLRDSGFDVVGQYGIGHVPDSVKTGSFSFRELVANWGVNDDPEGSYLLAYHCRLAGT